MFDESCISQHCRKCYCHVIKFIDINGIKCIDVKCDKTIKYNNIPAGNSNEVFSLCRIWMATITTFPFWSDERGDVYDADQHQIGDGIGKPLDADEDSNA